MAMANYRIRGPGLSYDEEFQHHGVLGQRWGVITRNVGVNYIPVGQRTGTGSVSGAKDVVTKGVNSFVTGVKNIKAKYDAKQAQKPLNINKLSRRKISKLTEEELKMAIERANLEEKLYKQLHPNSGQQVVNGKNAMADAIMKFTKDVGYGIMKDYTQNSLKLAIRDHILKDSSLTPEQMADKLSLYGFKLPSEFEGLLKDQKDQIEFSKTSKKVGDILQSYGPDKISQAIADIDARGMGKMLSKQFRENAEYMDNLKAFDRLASGYDLRDPKQASEFVAQANAHKLGNFITPNIQAMADLGRVDVYNNARADYVKSVFENPNLSTTDKARFADTANRFVSSTLKTKPVEGSANSIFNALYGDYIMGQNYNQYGPSGYSGYYDPNDTSTWD